MLTAKQNLREVVKGGNPDRFVNQYEAINVLFHPFFMFSNPLMTKGMENVVNAWGITNSWYGDTPGGFPVHTPDKIVIKDIEHWRDYVHAPSLEFTDEQWGIVKGMYDAVDGDMAFKAAWVLPGLFEQVHHLSEIKNALMYYITNPQEMHDLIAYLTDFELALAEQICANLHPDAIFHHDDWGTESTTFLRPEMFDEFFVEPYKQVYGYYHDHGVELIVHHNDSYSATLVPEMIEVGIDIWQGCMKSNNVPELIAKYGGKISFMGNIDNKAVDFYGWTQEDAKKAVEAACTGMSPNFYIPCITQGAPGSVFDGTYMALIDEIDAFNMKTFGFTKEQLEGARFPLQLLD